MRALVLVMDYPRPDGSVALMYVHVRNKYYIHNGIEVTVLNFASKNDYVIDGIPVISLDTYKGLNQKYDILISHAANIRNHYRFIKKYESRFNKFLFFFHGHEVLKLNETYPKPYLFLKKQSFVRKSFQSAYDCVKLKLWHDYYIKLLPKSKFVFVSNWLYERFQKYTKIPSEQIQGNGVIINNSVAKIFEECNYQFDNEKKYDFITIRSYLDTSKYAVDVVVELAKNNPELSFLVVGKGSFFNYYKKPDNVIWINKYLQHEEMIEMLNQSRCGLMPTREDTQGVMTCEMATFGIPVITSNIEVCREIFSNFKNVYLVDNNSTDIDLRPIINTLISNVPYEKDYSYFQRNTTKFEIDLIKSLSQ